MPYLGKSLYVTLKQLTSNSIWVSFFWVFPVCVGGSVYKTVSKNLHTKINLYYFHGKGTNDFRRVGSLEGFLAAGPLLAFMFWLNDMKLYSWHIYVKFVSGMFSGHWDFIGYYIHVEYQSKVYLIKLNEVTKLFFSQKVSIFKIVTKTKFMKTSCMKQIFIWLD